MIRVISGATICGYNRSSFDRDGQAIVGYSIYFTYPMIGDYSRGDAVGSLWVSKSYFDSHVSDLEIGNSLSVARLRAGDKSKFQLVG